MIQELAEHSLKQLPGVEDVVVNLVWNPPWDPRTMASDEIKMLLGIW
jgi:metal-sulfur cluster biosynthetic enzyme